MTIPPADTLRSLLSGLVSPEHLADPAARAERWARARWSVLVEPGDGVAGRLIGALGAVDALAVALDVESRFDGESLPGVTAPEFARARERWLPRRDDHLVPFALAQRVGARLLVPGDPAWPSRVDELGPHAPVALWARGRTGVLGDTGPAVAIVGARAATAYGLHTAAEIAGDLAAGGVCIVSGAAFGIDAAAHRATLAVGGRAIAVLAGGVDRAYPSAHADLLTAIAERGVVVSEVPCGTAPTKWRFLQRNRVIAALGDATLIVEAGWRSGSLNTAGHAAALGRPLGAVPGPVTSAASAGCHRVLREYDGTCVTGAGDVRELIGWGEADQLDLGAHGAAPARGSDAGDARTDDRTRVLDALSPRAARGVEDIARRAGLGAGDTSILLGLLALEGRVAGDARGWRLTR